MTAKSIETMNGLLQTLMVFRSVDVTYRTE